MSYPKLSVITAVLNKENSLERTILSVIAQDYNNLEFIIIDGGSTDGTIEIIKKYRNHLKYWVSEKDNGISDAFNKGVRNSTGDFINFQGADDYFIDNSVVSKMMEGVDTDTDMLVCGRINRVHKNNVLYTSNLNFNRYKLLYKMGLPHQALFTNKRFFDKYGLFDLNCKFAMDYELLLRSYKEFPEVILKDVIVSAWSSGGIGENRLSEILDEYHRIKLKHKIAPTQVLFLVDKIVRMKYLFSDNNA